MSNGGIRDRRRAFCARCSAELTPGRGDHYVVKIIAVADPAPPRITEEDLARDVGREIRRLVEQLKGVPEQDIEDDVYQWKILYLCTACYRHWIRDPAGNP
jgi:hypothetical protein